MSGLNARDQPGHGGMGPDPAAARSGDAPVRQLPSKADAGFHTLLLKTLHLQQPPVRHLICPLGPRRGRSGSTRRH